MKFMLWVVSDPAVSTKNDYFSSPKDYSSRVVSDQQPVNLVNGIILIILLHCDHPIDRLVLSILMFFLTP